MSGLWRVAINEFSPSADIRSAVYDGDKIICADLMHVEADRIVKLHNAQMGMAEATKATLLDMYSRTVCELLELRRLKKAHSWFENSLVTFLWGRLGSGAESEKNIRV